jgi:hypothetical protein
VNAVVISVACTEILRQSLRRHCVYTAHQRRIYSVICYYDHTTTVCSHCAWLLLADIQVQQINCSYQSGTTTEGPKAYIQLFENKQIMEEDVSIHFVFSMPSAQCERRESAVNAVQVPREHKQSPTINPYERNRTQWEFVATPWSQ